MADLKVLYVEDEPLLGRIVKESLASRGCDIDWFKSGGEAAGAMARASTYDIAVLDVQLPGPQNGFELGKALRRNHPDLPILYLTARVEARDALEGFASGGNDYVRKPFSMEELLVRMENLVGLSATAAPKDTFRRGKLAFDYHRQTLTRDGKIQTLTHREAELLRYLLQRTGQEVIHRDKLLLAIWGDDSFFHSRSLDVYIRKIRAYLEGSGVEVVTLRGVGYRLVVGDADQG